MWVTTLGANCQCGFSTRGRLDVRAVGAARGEDDAVGAGREVVARRRVVDVAVGEDGEL